MLLPIIFAAVMLPGCAEQPAEDAQAPPEGTAAPLEPVEVEPMRVETRQAEPYGAYLTDAEGRSLYLFMADSSMTSTCYDACADAWPPLMAPEGETVAGEGVNAALLSTFERRDGSLQVAYDGWPLYYYVQDSGPGQTTGQDVEGFGAEWYLISPEGEHVEAEGGTSSDS